MATHHLKYCFTVVPGGGCIADTVIKKNTVSRLTRWRLKLVEYKYEIHFKPGASNTNAEALSKINRVVTRSSKSPNSTECPNCTEPSTHYRTFELRRIFKQLSKKFKRKNCISSKCSGIKRRHFRD